MEPIRFPARDYARIQVPLTASDNVLTPIFVQVSSKIPNQARVLVLITISYLKQLLP